MTGVVVIPDFVANSSTNSWWWWTLFGDVAPEQEAAYSIIRSVMRDLVTRVLDRTTTDCSPREAAVQIATENLVAIRERVSG